MDRIKEAIRLVDLATHDIGIQDIAPLAFAREELLQALVLLREEWGGDCERCGHPESFHGTDHVCSAGDCAICTEPPLVCAKCGGNRVYSQGIGEGYSCPDCHASDTDE